AERFRGIRERQVEVVDEHDHGPLLPWKPGEAPLELVADREPALVAGDRRFIGRGQLDLGGVDAAGPLPATEARPHQEPARPRVESIRIAEPGQRAPGLDTGLLD